MVKIIRWCESMLGVIFPGMNRFWTMLWALLLLVVGCGGLESERSGPEPSSSSDAGSVDANHVDAGSSDASDASQAPDTSNEDARVPPDVGQKPELRVLFIGNSYTSVNDLPKALTALGASEGSPVTYAVKQHTPGGATWEDHAANPAVAALIAEGWDYVVLQDQSQQPWLYTTGVKPALLSLAAMAENAGAKPVLYMTWARNTSSTSFPTRFEQEMAVNNYYSRHAEAANALVAPVGRAWERALREPGIVLHAEDASHPTELGTYLAACVFHATLTGKSPVGLGSGGFSLSLAERTRMQEVAWETGVARERLTPPAVGVWPLGDALPSNDMVPQGVAFGDALGPLSWAELATQFGTDAYAAIPYFPGINAPRLTVAFFAHRDDWTQPTSTYETLVAKSWGYSLVQFQSKLEARLYTVNQDAFPYPSYDVSYLGPGWHHFALTYDGASYALFIDAIPVASATASGDVRYYGLTPGEQTYDGIAVGANTVDTVATWGTPSATFSGAMADLRLFDQALGIGELNALANQ